MSLGHGARCGIGCGTERRFHLARRLKRLGDGINFTWEKNVGMTGHVALITGGLSGIGAATARALHQKGAKIVILDKNARTDTVGKEEQITRLGCDADLLCVDVTDAAAVQEAVDAVAREHVITDFVSSAAWSVRQLLLDASEEGFRRTFEVTFFGAVRVIKAVAQKMVEHKKGGSIVVVGSPLGERELAMPGSMAYNCAKAALHQAAAGAAAELFPHGVRVNTVLPGWTDTEGERQYFSESALRDSAALLPLKRLARPEEIAAAIAFLADPQTGSYCVGTVMKLDGGFGLPSDTKRIHDDPK
jgi:glucose 1-dehydrogenase